MNDNNNSNKRRRSTPALSGYSTDVGAGSSADVEAVSSADDGWNGQLGYVWIFRCCRTKDGQQLSYYILFMFLRNSNTQTRWLFSCSASKILPQKVEINFSASAAPSYLDYVSCDLLSEAILHTETMSPAICSAKLSVILRPCLLRSAQRSYLPSLVHFPCYLPSYLLTAPF